MASRIYTSKRFKNMRYAADSMWEVEEFWKSDVTSAVVQSNYREMYYINTTRNVLVCDQSNVNYMHTFLIYYSKAAVSFLSLHTICRLRLLPLQSKSPITTDHENHTLEPKTRWISWSVADIWSFEIFQSERLVGRRSASHQYLNIHILMSYTPICYVRNVRRRVSGVKTYTYCLLWFNIMMNHQLGTVHAFKKTAPAPFLSAEIQITEWIKTERCKLTD